MANPEPDAFATSMIGVLRRDSTRFDRKSPQAGDHAKRGRDTKAGHGRRGGRPAVAAGSPAGGGATHAGWEAGRRWRRPPPAPGQGLVEEYFDLCD